MIPLLAAAEGFGFQCPHHCSFLQWPVLMPKQLIPPLTKGRCANDSLSPNNQHRTQFLTLDGFRSPNYGQGYPPSIWQDSQEDIGLKSHLLHKVRKIHSLLCVADITLCCWDRTPLSNMHSFTSHVGNLTSVHPSDLTAKYTFVCFAFLWYSFW